MPSLLLYLPPSGHKPVLRHSHHLSLIPIFILPIQSTEKPSSCAKSGTVALNAPSSRTLHSFTCASKRNRPNPVQGPWAASLIVTDVLNGKTAHESQACLLGRWPPTRNGQSPLDTYRPRSSHVIQTPSRRRVYWWWRHSNAVSSAAIDSSNNF